MNAALLREITQINQRLINTDVDIIDEDVNMMAAVGSVQGMIIKLTFRPTALSSSLKSQDISAQTVSYVKLTRFST